LVKREQSGRTPDSESKMNDAYLDTVRLLLSIAPDVFATPRFAMKGGTAINLFLQDLPRLSVDIDFVFLSHEPSRDEALNQISEELARASRAIERQGYSVSSAIASACTARARNIQCRARVAHTARSGALWEQAGRRHGSATSARHLRCDAYV
jgi:predicted nucleotidyltransferase component of viral defense system